MSNGYDADLAAARATLQRAARVSELFCRWLGAVAPIMVPPFGAHLGRRPAMIQSVIDHKYWFAKLYELITYYEIGACERFVSPGFVMHFIPVFYNLYYDALQNFLAPNHAAVSTLWMRHFQGPGQRVAPTDLDAVRFSIVTGVTAHVQGDMASALESAYRSWSASPKPAFSTLYEDFFARNRPIFEVVKAQFFLDLAQKGPFPMRPEISQTVIGLGEQVAGGGLEVNEVYRWRETAWRTAEGRLSSPAAAGPGP